MLWDHYVFRRGDAVHDLWDSLLKDRPVEILYIAGRGFDVRAETVMREFVAGQQGAERQTLSAKLLLLVLHDYELDEGLEQLTEENATALEAVFAPLGRTEMVTVATRDGEDEVSASDMLRQRVKAVLDEVDGKTDIIFDVSSLPRATYLALLTSILQKLVPNKIVDEGAAHPLYADGVNFQVLVAEDANLKLITLGTGLACFEMRPADLHAKYGVAIPHAEPRRYLASADSLRQSKAEVSVLLLTGDAYGE